MSVEQLIGYNPYLYTPVELGEYMIVVVVVVVLHRLDVQN
jgi:hypothetical protein